MIGLSRSKVIQIKLKPEPKKKKTIKANKQDFEKLKLTIEHFPEVQFGYTILGTRLDILNSMEIWDGKVDKEAVKKHSKCEGSADGIWFQDRRGNINQSSTWSRAVNRAFTGIGKSLIHRRCLKYLRDLEKGGFVICDMGAKSKNNLTGEMKYNGVKIKDEKGHISTVAMFIRIK